MTLLGGACALLLPALTLAQIPMPSGIPNPFDQKPAAAKKADPAAQAQAKIDALKSQLAAIKELSSWASTNRSDLWKLYSDSLANLMQAHSTIHRAKGETAPPYTEPKGFEIEHCVASKDEWYPASVSSYTVSTVPPDSFYVHTRVTFPDEWVTAKKRLTVSFQMYSEEYLPMATTYQNTSNAIFRAYSYSLNVTTKTMPFRAGVVGLGLVPGRYYVSAVVSTYDYPRETLVSLGMFRVEGKVPATIKGILPHYVDWYRTWDQKVKLSEAKAVVKGKTITVSGAYERLAFAKGLKPAWIEAIAEQGDKKFVILRLQQPITTAKMKFGAKGFAVADHGLATGTYTLRVRVYTEHPSSDTKYAYNTGSRDEKTVALKIP